MKRQRMRKKTFEEEESRRRKEEIGRRKLAKAENQPENSA